MRDINQMKGARVMEKADVYKELVINAHNAGMEALEKSVPTPMVVSQHENMLDDNSPVKESWYVSEGMCGFAWVKLKNARQSLVCWMRKNDIGYKSYYGGWEVWPSHVARAFGLNAYNGQSIEKKEAYSHGFAAVLKDAGFDCYVDSRLD